MGARSGPGHDAPTMKPCVVALASKMLCTSVVTHFEGAYSRSSQSAVALTTVYCGQSRPWQNLRGDEATQELRACCVERLQTLLIRRDQHLACDGRTTDEHGDVMVQLGRIRGEMGAGPL